MIKKGEVDFDAEEWKSISQDAKDLILKLIAPVKKRLTAKEALEDKWVLKWGAK